MNQSQRTSVCLGSEHAITCKFFSNIAAFSFIYIISCSLCAAVEPAISYRPMIDSNSKISNILNIEDNYYLGERRLDFGNVGGELFKELYGNPESRRLAVSARRRYKAGQIVLIPTLAAGLALLYVSGSLGSSVNTDKMRGYGVATIATGFALNIILTNKGKIKYKIAIDKYNGL